MTVLELKRILEKTDDSTIVYTLSKNGNPMKESDIGTLEATFSMRSDEREELNGLYLVIE